MNLTRLSLAVPAALAMFATAPAFGQACAPAQEASYQLVFESVWTENTHPQDFPFNNPHFSQMVGGTHNDSVTFWEAGQLASQGIQFMAEFGSKPPLEFEVQEAINAGTAYRIVSATSGIVSPGSTSVEVDVTIDYPLATVVSMIAPSPDWFIGTSGTNLFVDGDWVDGLVVDLYPYDAGTDSGPSYLSPNQPTLPPEPAFRINGFPFLNGGTVQPLGTYTFNLVDTVCVDSDTDTVSDAVDNCLSVANEDQRDTDGDGIGNACDADLDNNCQVSFNDLAAFKSVVFTTNEDADFNGDGAVNFSDLGILKSQFFADFTVDNPSAAPNVCAPARL